MGVPDKLRGGLLIVIDQGIVIEGMGSFDERDSCPPSPEALSGEMGWGEIFPAGVRPDSTSRGDLFLLPAFSTVRSVVFRWMFWVGSKSW